MSKLKYARRLVGIEPDPNLLLDPLNATSDWRSIEHQFRSFDEIVEGFDSLFGAIPMVVRTTFPWQYLCLSVFFDGPKLQMIGVAIAVEVGKQARSLEVLLTFLQEQLQETPQYFALSHEHQLAADRFFQEVIDRYSEVASLLPLTSELHECWAPLRTGR